ncbi:DsbA family protein [Leptospira langatensis]|uniref:DsbA family protein n=1 Tax=Leptospira langatensis TaxID=2484983 RepID=A0A5F1ZTU0_9LEPT|nr:DsbA family protein [Leptospira langatensis]TGJ98848.1 DsbA family protein [Leptospira langatensis]TGL40586.1 DsbA family protein [Leptospira langatensis]
MDLEIKRPEGKHSIVYVADPICTWCYGFAPIFQKIREKYSDKIDFTLVLGGLRYGQEVEAFTEEVTDKLKYLWKEVERISKRSFHYEILKDRSILYDSEPGSRAVITAQRLDPKISFAYLDRLSESFHAQGKNPNDFQNYLDIAEEFSLSPQEFQEVYQREETLLETRNDFNYGYILGVTGFPCLVFSDGIDRGILTKGFLPFSEVDEILSDYFRSIGTF